MKKDIHPQYQATTITCACGEVIETRSTGNDMRIEICSKCHPVFTGKQKLVDTAGRVDRFKAMMETSAEKQKDKKEKKTRQRKQHASHDIKTIMQEQAEREAAKEKEKAAKEKEKLEEEMKTVKVIKKGTKADDKPSAKKDAEKKDQSKKDKDVKAASDK